MTVSQIKELTHDTCTFEDKQLQHIATVLPIYDSCNYILWMEKLHNRRIYV